MEVHFMAARIAASHRVLSRGYRTLGRLSLMAAVSVALASPLAVTPPASAQEVPAQPDVPNSARTIRGKTKAASLVFSGPGSNYYPTLKLPADTEVIVVGKSKEWLKI